MMSEKEALRALHAAPDLSDSVWRDPADHAYIATHLIERSIALLAPRLRGRLLDVGCGQQPYRKYFAHLEEVVACDFDGARGQVDFTCPADRIPVADGSFEAILCTEVLEHVPDPRAVWREFHRVLRAGGQVLLTTPMYWPAHEEPHDYFRFPRCGLRAIVESAGFEIEEFWPRGGSWAFLGQVALDVMRHYLPFKWMQRLYNRAFLKLDRARCNPHLSLGWTVLARKPQAVHSHAQG